MNINKSLQLKTTILSVYFKEGNVEAAILHNTIEAPWAFLYMVRKETKNSIWVILHSGLCVEGCTCFANQKIKNCTFGPFEQFESHRPPLTLTLDASSRGIVECFRALADLLHIDINCLRETNYNFIVNRGGRTASLKSELEENKRQKRILFFTPLSLDSFF